MKNILCLFLCLLMTCSCRGKESEPLSSPSGECTIKTAISGEEAGETRRFCVKLIFIETKSKKELSCQTGASDYQKWAVGWSPKNVLILYSSDIGTFAYEIVDGKINERMATNEEKELGKDFYKNKYGRRPSH
ncbi:MAG TPA: hypothetical protein DCZ94_18555 [Lentisphaeria bacterium]|nr:MAG: hypothetical protein A2X48_24115 [Lentisphaerae bacterium GWF2_49_21]HBC88948.1 hypothetical protein [Lentisphaeria bacterium]